MDESFDGLPRGFKRVCLNDMIGTAAFFVVGHLACQHRLKHLGRGAGPCKNAAALFFGVSGDNDRNIDKPITARFKQQGNIDNDNGGGGIFSNKFGAVFSNKWMNDGFDPIKRCWVLFDDRFQLGAINLPINDGCREMLGNRRHSRATAPIQPMHRGVSIPHGNAQIAEHCRSRRFSHPNGPGQTNNDSHQDNTACRNSSSTSGV